MRSDRALFCCLQPAAVAVAVAAEANVRIAEKRTRLLMPAEEPCLRKTNAGTGGVVSKDEVFHISSFI